MESIFDKGASLPAMRFLTALSMRKPDKVEDMSRQLWLRLWGQVHIAAPLYGTLYTLYRTVIVYSSATSSVSIRDAASL